MADVSLQQPETDNSMQQPVHNADMLNTVSVFQPTTPGTQPTTPHKPITTTPSLPNSGFRKLNIDTPITNNDSTTSNAEDAESKELEPSDPTKDSNPTNNVNTANNVNNVNNAENVNNAVSDPIAVATLVHKEDEQDDCLINDSFHYVTNPEHKSLKKILESHPDKMYDRFQSRDLSKLEAFLHDKRTAFFEKKRAKLQADSSDKIGQNSKSDKLEMDDDPETVSEVKKAQISTEQKVEIIERALAAAQQNLVHFNKLLLSPLQSVHDQQQREQHIATKQQIQSIKLEIEAKRTSIVQRIGRLQALRRGMDNVPVVIPQAVRNKMAGNLDYERGGGPDGNEALSQKQERTKQVIAMVSERRQGQMAQLQAERAELARNEQRLRERAQQIEAEGERLREFIELKQRNQRALERERRESSMMMDVDPEAQGGRNRLVSMASSVASTIHGDMSPEIRDKFKRDTEREQREDGGGGVWSFEMLRNAMQSGCDDDIMF